MNKFNLPESIDDVRIREPFFSPQRSESDNDPFAICVRTDNTQDGQKTSGALLLPHVGGKGATRQFNVDVTGLPDLETVKAPGWYTPISTLADDGTPWPQSLPTAKTAM